MSFCSHSRQMLCVNSGFILLISLASLELQGLTTEQANKSDFTQNPGISWDG